MFSLDQIPNSTDVFAAQIRIWRQYYFYSHDKGFEIAKHHYNVILMY